MEKLKVTKNMEFILALSPKNNIYNTSLGKQHIYA